MRGAFACAIAAAILLGLTLVSCGQATTTAPDAPVSTAAPTLTSVVENDEADASTEEDGSSGATVVEGPCAVVTRGELEAAVGQPLTREEVNGTRCTYYTDDPLVFVTLEVDRENAKASWQGVTAGQDLAGAESNKASGLGDEAFFGARDVLYVRDGDTFLMIEAGFDDKVCDPAEKVAKLLLDRTE